METFFIYKKNNCKDDCSSMRYIEIPKNIEKFFECGNYFRRVNIESVDYSFQFEKKENIITILSQNDIDNILKYNKEISELKYGINEGDKRYKKGINLIKTYLEPIFEKLKSKENKELYSKLVKQEKKILIEKYDLSLKDINYIIENYPFGEYIDSAMIEAVYDDKEKFAEDIGWEEGYITTENCTYINLEKLADYLLKKDRFLELQYFDKNNKIIVFRY